MRFIMNWAAAMPIAPADGISHIATNMSSSSGADRTIVTAKHIRCAARMESVGTVHLRRMASRKGSPDGYRIASPRLHPVSVSHMIQARWSCHALNPTMGSFMHERMHAVDLHPT